jgi:AcrR family transcriptional regulator
MIHARKSAKRTIVKAKTKKKRVRLDAALRREKILDEAILLVGRRGYHGFSIQELAQRCNLTNAGLLYYFGSKERLLIDLLESRDRRDAAAVSSMVGLKPSDGGRATVTFEKTVEVLHAIVARNCTQPEIVRLYAVLQSEALDSAHPAHDYFVRREARVIEAFTKMLAPHVDRPRSTVRHLLGLLNGLEQQWLRANMAFDLVAEWDSAVAALLPRPKGGRHARGHPSS